MKRQDFYKNKVIIITGASSGIGKAAAELFASQGANLCLAARSLDKLEQLASQISNPNQILCVKTDVSIEADCKNLIEQCVAKFGKIDILINNAGLSMRALFKDVDLSVMHRLMDINYWGTVYCTKYAIPYLLQTQGSVVGVISIAGYAGLPGRTGYASSKFAIRGFLSSLRIEHIYDNLHVMIFAPGFTASNIRNSALLADGSTQGSTPRDENKMMSAEKAVQYLDRGLKRRRDKMILSRTGKITIALNALVSRLADRLEFNYMAKEPNSPFSKSKK